MTGPPAADIEVWFVDLERCRKALLAAEAECPRLQPDHNLLLGGDRHLAHVALRIALERLVGPLWRGVPLDIMPGGRPELPIGNDGKRPASFSLSHTAAAQGGLALVAVAARGPIGIDIEHRRAVRMSAYRRAAIRRAGHALAPQQRRLGDDEAGLLSAWSRLESVSKADGRGMARLLSHLGARGHGEIADEELAMRVRGLLDRLDLVVRDLDSTDVTHGLPSAIAHPRDMGVRCARFPATEAGIAALISA